MRSKCSHALFLPSWALVAQSACWVRDYLVAESELSYLLYVTEMQSSDASRQFRASPSRCAFERRWRNVGDRVKVATLNWHYFLTSTHSEWKQPVVNGRGGSLPKHKVGTFAFLRPSPRFSRMALCGAVGVLIWPPIKSSLACAQKTTYSYGYIVWHIALRPSIYYILFWNVLNATTRVFKKLYKKVLEQQVSS